MDRSNTLRGALLLGLALAAPMCRGQDARGGAGTAPSSDAELRAEVRELRARVEELTRRLDRVEPTAPAATPATAPAPEGDATRRRPPVELIAHLTLAQHDVGAAIWSRSGDEIVSAGENGLITWDARSGAQLGTVLLDGGPDKGLVAWSGDEGLLATDAGLDVVWLDAKSGREVARQATTFPRALDWSPSKRRLAILTRTAALLFDGDGRKLTELGVHDAHAVAWSPAGDRLAVGEGRTLSIWDPERAKQLRRLSHEDEVTDVAWSPDGAQLAVASGDGLSIWRSNEGTLVTHIGTSTDGVAWSPDGGHLAVTAEGGVLRILDVGSWRVACTARHEPRESASPQGHLNVRWAPGGLRLATSGGGVIRTWELPAGPR